MLEIALSSFWKWLGAMLLLWMVWSGIADIIKAAHRPQRKVRVYKFADGSVNVDIECATDADVERALDVRKEAEQA